MASFKEAFAAARKKLGAGKTFEWNGKSYSTNYKEETGKSASAAPTKSIRPKAKPASNTAPVSAVSGASRSAANKVQPKKEAPVPGRAIAVAIKNAFTGNGETDAAKISASGNKNLGRSSAAKPKSKPAMAPNRASVAKKK
jgi:hypothetical protein